MEVRLLDSNGRLTANPNFTSTAKIFSRSGIGIHSIRTQSLELHSIRPHGLRRHDVSSSATFDGDPNLVYSTQEWGEWTTTTTLSIPSDVSLADGIYQVEVWPMVFDSGQLVFEDRTVAARSFFQVASSSVIKSAAGTYEVDGTVTIPSSLTDTRKAALRVCLFYTRSTFDSTTLLPTDAFPDASGKTSPEAVATLDASGNYKLVISRDVLTANPGPHRIVLFEDKNGDVKLATDLEPFTMLFTKGIETDPSGLFSLVVLNHSTTSPLDFGYTAESDALPTVAAGVNLDLTQTDNDFNSTSSTATGLVVHKGKKR